MDGASPKGHPAKTCNFTLKYDLEEALDVPIDHIPFDCACAWCQPPTVTGGSFCDDNTPEDMLDEWKLSKPKQQSRHSSPESIKKHRRVHLFRFYTSHDTPKETRSERYVFLHHNNWPQYMKQYRKYHTVGQVGQVNCEDLEWKNLLRHIKIGETLKELLFNSSSSLHPSPKFPSMDHWCRHKSLPATAPPASIVHKARDSLKKRNHYKSFNLTFVQPKKIRTPKDINVGPEKRDIISNKYVGLRENMTTNRSALEIRVGNYDDMDKQDSASSGERKQLNGKSQNNAKRNTCFNGGRGERCQLLPKWKHENKMADTVYASSSKSRDNRSLETVLTGVNSYLRKEEIQPNVEFKIYKPESLGSLKLGSISENVLEREKREHFDRILRKTSERNRFSKEKVYNREHEDMKKRQSVKFKKECLHDFSIISYGSPENEPTIQVTPSNMVNHDLCKSTVRYAKPLPVETVICGNQYGTAEDHERRLAPPETVPF